MCGYVECAGEGGLVEVGGCRGRAYGRMWEGAREVRASVQGRRSVPEKGGADVGGGGRVQGKGGMGKCGKVPGRWGRVVGGG